jgi:hypothetical protein
MAPARSGLLARQRIGFPTCPIRLASPLVGSGTVVARASEPLAHGTPATHLHLRPSTEAGAPGVSDTTREQSMNVGAGWATRGRWSRLSWAAVAFRSSGRGHEARAHTHHAPIECPRPSLPRPCLAWPSRHPPTHQFLSLPPASASSSPPPRPCVYSKAVKASQGVEIKATVTGRAPR